MKKRNEYIWQYLPLLCPAIRLAFCFLCVESIDNKRKHTPMMWVNTKTCINMRDKKNTFWRNHIFAFSFFPLFIKKYKGLSYSKRELTFKAAMIYDSQNTKKKHK